MNRVNSRNDFGHDDSTINIVVAINNITILIYTGLQFFDAVGWVAGRSSGW